MLFVVDGAVGMTDDDEAIATWLRKGRQAVLVVVNKADNDRRENDRWEFLALGLGEPFPVSALHGRRAGDLLDEVVARFPATAQARRARRGDARGPRASRRGRRTSRRRPASPSSGAPTSARRTLFNRLVGEDRSVVHDLAGTTRDSIDTLVETEDGPIVFVDTAGMRARGRGSTTRPSTTRSCGRCARSTTPTSPCS